MTGGWSDAGQTERESVDFGPASARSLDIYVVGFKCNAYPISPNSDDLLGSFSEGRYIEEIVLGYQRCCRNGAYYFIITGKNETGRNTGRQQSDALVADEILNPRACSMFSVRGRIYFLG